MARRKNDSLQTESALSFEEALAGLEAIVDSMENENLPLEELVAGYENGSVLLERCESVLHSARKRIELITLRAKSPVPSDELASEDDDDHSPLSSADADATDDDDDIRLF